MNISLALMFRITDKPLSHFVVETTMMTRTLTAYWPGIFWFKHKIVFSESDLISKLKHWTSYHYHCHISTEVVTVENSDVISHYQITLKIPDYFLQVDNAELVFRNKDELQAIIDACEFVNKETR